MPQVDSGYRDGLKSAFDILRPLAQQGEHEASIIIDQITGQHLDIQIGERDEVSPDWGKIPIGTRVTVLHTHNENVAFGPEDWDVLANQASVAEIRVVCPNGIYGLVKPINWEFQKACRPGLSVLGSVFERLLAAVRVDPAYSADKFEASNMRNPVQIYETNQRMLRSVMAQGFLFFKE